MNDSNVSRYYLLKKIVIALVLLLLVFIPIELFSRFIASTSLAPFGEALRVDQKVLVTDSINSNGIVAIGDSIIARSFYPELFFAILSENLSISYPVYNLGVEGSNLNGQLAIYKRLIKNNAKPRIVIINIAVHNLNLDKSVLKDNYDAIDYFTRCKELQKRTLSSKIYCGFAENLYFFKLLNFYHQQVNNSLKNLFHTAQARHANLIQNNPAVSYMGFSPIFSVLTPDSVNTDYLYQAMINNYRKTYQHYELGTDRLDGIIDEFNKQSTKVVLVLMPLYQPLMRKVHDNYSLPANKVIINKLEQFAQRKKIAFVNLFEELQDPENFQDPVHVNVVGAAKITTILAKKILAKDYSYPEGYLDSEIYQFMKKNGTDKS